MFLSIYLSTYLSIYLSLSLSVCLSIYLPVYLQAWKRSYFTRLPDFLNLTTSKTKQFCETSSFLELDNIQNEAFLRDFVNFWTWQHQKRSNSARLPSKMESWLQRWRPRTNVFCNFFQSTCRKYCACHEKVMPGHMKCCACHAKSSQQTWRSDAPKCNPSQEISALTA